MADRKKKFPALSETDVEALRELVHLPPSAAPEPRPTFESRDQRVTAIVENIMLVIDAEPLEDVSIALATVMNMTAAQQFRALGSRGS
jgi:hypothetical protein